MQLTIQPLAAEDRQQWEQLYHGYAEFYRVPMNDEILDQLWEWIFADAPRMYALLAKDGDGNAIGLMHFREMISPLRGKSVGFLDDLFIKPECRGSGAVEQMFAALRDAGNAQGWPFVRWITAEDNYRGRAVYDRLAEKTAWQTYQMATD